jgi:excisionase family DNA binding protein
MHPDTTAFDLLTLAEVAKLLHCSKAHVCNILSGRVDGCVPIPSVRMGRRLLVRRETLMVWIERNETASLSRPVR